MCEYVERVGLPKKYEEDYMSRLCGVLEWVVVVLCVVAIFLEIGTLFS